MLTSHSIFTVYLIRFGISHIYIFNVNLYHTGTYYYMNIIMYNYIYILYMHVHSQYYCILSEHNYLSRYGHTLLFEYISIEHIYIYIDEE